MEDGGLSYELVLKHYLNKDVNVDLAKYAKGRWVAVHCMEKSEGGRRLMVRYLKGGRPLKITDVEDVEGVINKFKLLKPRTFYATANVYKKLNSFKDVADLSNIEACSPIWDIDNAIDKWRATMAVCREITSFLEDRGVRKSAFIKWSGKAAHIHINEEAFSPELRTRIHPLDLAYATVGYTIMKLKNKLLDIAAQHQAPGLRVDNEVDPQRVFTCPLSLHRELDIVCICISPNEIDNFSLEWLKIQGFKHYKGWGRFEVGEADELGEKAYEFLGGYPSLPRIRRRRHPPIDVLIRRWLTEGAKL